jgi:Tol biopolymer transport system component
MRAALAIAQAKEEYPMTYQSYTLRGNSLFVRSVLVASLVLAVSSCHWLKRASVNSAGVEGDETSTTPSLSASGRYVAFVSYAANLNMEEYDSNDADDVFVHDVLEGTTILVSGDINGDTGDHISDDPSISADGRYVAFVSGSSNLVEGGTNDVVDIYVRDTTSGITSLVSVDSDESVGNDHSSEPSISADGRYVAFSSSASNLVAGDTNGAVDIFVRDTVDGTTTRISVSSSDAQTNQSSFEPSISADSRYVAFRSLATNLVAGDTNGAWDIFVRDTVDGITTRVSVNSDEIQASFSGNSYRPSLSADGRHIAFVSIATNLAAGDTNSAADIFVRDAVHGTTALVSVNSEEVKGNRSHDMPSISGDGRYVAFQSDSTNLVTGDTNSNWDIFVRDTLTGTTTRASLSGYSAQGNGQSLRPSISADGRYVAYDTSSSNIMPGDTNSRQDIYVKAIPEVAVNSVIPDHLPVGATTSVTVTGTNFLPGATPWLNGATLSNVEIVDESTITMVITISAGIPTGTYDLGVNLFGTGPGAFTGSSATCVNCVTFQ